MSLCPISVGSVVIDFRPRSLLNSCQVTMSSFLEKLRDRMVVSNVLIEEQFHVYVLNFVEKT